MKIEILLHIGGIFHLIWALFDSFWPRIFNWKETLSSLDDLHRVLLPIISKLLVILYLAIAYISLFHTVDLITSNLGKTLLIFITVYWVVRAILQVYYIGFNKANKFNVNLSSFAPYFPFNIMSNKAISYYFFIIFVIMIALYFIPLLYKITC